MSGDEPELHALSGDNSNRLRAELKKDASTNEPKKDIDPKAKAKNERRSRGGRHRA